MSRYRYMIEFATPDGEEAFTVYLEACARAREVGRGVKTSFRHLDGIRSLAVSGDSDADLDRFDGEPSGVGQGVDPEHHDAEVAASEPETSGADDAAGTEASASVADTSAPEEPDA